MIEGSRSITALHKSFPDYLTDRSRCKDSRFYVDPAVHHGKLAIYCLDLMEMRLIKANICDLPRYVMNKDVEDLAARRKEHIDGALEYGCRFWAKHLRLACRTGEDVVKILERLRRFMERQLLRWLEVLSIVGDLRVAVYSLDDVKAWLIDVRPSTLVILLTY